MEICTVYQYKRIHGTFSKKDIPLNKRNKIIFIRDPWIDYKIIKQKLETGSQDYLYFSGELDQKLQPYSEGYYRGENQEIHATFQDGFSNKIQLYQSGNYYEIEKPDLNNSAICSDKDQMITLPTFRTCLEGRWLNQKVVDFYLDFAQLYLKLTKQNANIYKNYIINTCNSQDIFSSDIFEARNFSKESWEKYHEMNRIDLNDTSNRYIFATNIRKSHFVVFVLEWNQNEYQPILVDSLPSQYLHLGNDEETRIIKEVFSYIVKKPIGNLKKVKAPKQQNAYDCGVHSIYNSIIIFRNSTDPKAYLFSHGKQLCTFAQILLMKFDKILSHNNSPQQQNYYVQAKPTFVPPPLGLDVVTMPNGNIFDLFLKGRITAKQMLNMDVKEVSRVLRESPRRLTRHKSIKKNQSDQIFNLVERFQQQRKQTINFSQIQKQKPQPKLSRKETLMQLTSSTKELLQPIAQSRFRTPARKFSQRSTASGKEEQLITRYEKLSGERLKEEEKELLLKKEITDDDVWKMMNIFSKKKWFFDYIHRNLDQQNEPKLPTEEKQTQAVSLFQRLRNTVLKQQEGKKRKPEKQCQEYYAHIQNIEDSIKNSVFKREMPEQIRFQNKPNVKEFRSESVVSKLNIRNQFLQSADNFNVNSSNPNILHQVYEEGSQTCKMPTTARKHKLFTRRNPRASLSREIDISHESQSDSYKSITEYRLNELYRESNQRQKQYQQKYDTGTIFNGDQLQRKVKNLVKIGNIQKTILNVVSQKLQQ